MKRREFITLLGGAAALPIAASAQQRAMPIIGYLHISFPEPYANQVAAFREGLSEAGFVEGHNVLFDFRWAQNDPNRLPELAADLVRRRVTVIATPGGPAAALAAKAATPTIPIVFSSSIDPVQLGLVPSLNRPGGNITGFTDMHVDLSAKRLGLLHELIPGAARFAVLVNPSYPATEAIVADLRVAAAAIGRQIEVVAASTNREIDAAFASLSQRGIEALLVNPDSLFNSRRVPIATLARALPNSGDLQSARGCRCRRSNELRD